MAHLWLDRIHHLSPDMALLLVTLGVLLIYLELNRPGWIWSLAAGILAVLLGAAALGQRELNPAALGLVLVAIALLLLNLLRPLQTSVLLAATLAIVFGFMHLVLAPAAEGVHTVTAAGCGLVLGAGTSLLTRIAHRARTNKGLD
ncbi:MAG: hypothetical protein ACLGQX_15825 [Acidobacteriota bacterium]